MPVISPVNQPQEEPVTQWIRQLEGGQAASAQPLWDHFCGRLIAFAEKRLPTTVRRAYDEEDVAVSAFHSLCRAVGKASASNLQDRSNLWRLLTTITERKIANRLRYEHRDKRDSRRTMADVCLMKPAEQPVELDELMGREPTPEFAAEFADLCDQLLESLQDQQLRDIAQLKLQNYDATEIAETLGCTRRTVERKLIIIRTRWQLRLDAAEASA